MTFKNLLTSSLLMIIATNIATAASEDPRVTGTSSLKALSCIADCSSMILETDFDPSKNRVVAGDQALMMLNVLASLPGDNPLKAELAARSMVIDPKAFVNYNRHIANLNIADNYGAILLPTTISPDEIPLSLKSFGINVQFILDKDKAIENAAHINTVVCEATRGMISHLVSAEDLVLTGFTAVTASSSKALWDMPFEKEIKAPFETAMGSKQVTYLSGEVVADYKRDGLSEIISIPLKNGNRFVVFKPLTDRNLRFFDSSMLQNLKEEILDLKLPKIIIEGAVDLKQVLESSRLRGLGKKFCNSELELERFYQQTILKTTLTGVEAGAATLTEMLWGESIEVVVNCPYTIAIVVPLSDGTYIPLFMGYIGDPTSKSSTSEPSRSIEMTNVAGGAGRSSDDHL